MKAGSTALEKTNLRNMNLKVYLTSSVDGELIRYVESCLSRLGTVKYICTVSEADYRRMSRMEFIGRFLLRFWMYLWHPVRLIFKMIAAPRDTFWVVTTNPFYAPAIAVFVAKLKAQKVVYLLYDLFPDALEEACLIKRAGFFSALLGYSTRLALRESNQTIFLGEQLKTHAESRWGKARQSLVIPVVTSKPESTRPSESSGNPLMVHYGGQLGWMHDAERLAELISVYQAVRRPGAPVLWDFRISGSKAKVFENQMKGAPGINVSSILSLEQWRMYATSIPVGLVSLSPGGSQVCFPSKTYGMMACGMAILAMCPAKSDLGCLIEKYELGWVIDSSEGRNFEMISQQFDQVISGIVNDPQELLRRRQNAWDYIRKQNKLDEVGQRWQEALS